MAEKITFQNVRNFLMFVGRVLSLHHFVNDSRNERCLFTMNTNDSLNLS